MKQINLFFKTMLILCALVWSGNCAWAQSDMSAIFTSNVTLPSSGTNVSSCVVSIGGKQYDGTKLGKSPLFVRFIGTDLKRTWNGPETDLLRNPKRITLDSP